LAKEFGLDCVVLEESDMSALGMGSLLSVSKGSIESPKLISLSYQGKGNKPHHTYHISFHPYLRQVLKKYHRYQKLPPYPPKQSVWRYPCLDNSS
jgi:hypothetical protein